MTNSASLESASMSGKEPVDVLRVRAQAWWVSLVAGQLDQSHPIHGQRLRIQFENGVLTLTGELPSQADIDTLLAEAEEFRPQGIDELRSELSVAETPDEEGVLVQTLLSAFEGPEQAGFAGSIVLGHIHVHAVRLLVVEPGQSLDGLLPEGFRTDAESALAEGRSLLILTVDEVVAFAARQVLEEETRSLWTQALPPQPAAAP
jgi:hypothetical protein